MNDQDSLISHNKSSIELTDRSLDSVTVTEVKKRHVGSVRTGFTVFKAFFASAILFMPYQFLISGWLFTTIAFVILCETAVVLVAARFDVFPVPLASYVAAATVETAEDFPYVAGAVDAVACDDDFPYVAAG